MEQKRSKLVSLNLVRRKWIPIFLALMFGCYANQLMLISDNENLNHFFNVQMERANVN